MLIIYRQSPEGDLRLIGELPLRADLISRMPERHETKSIGLQLSGGDIRSLKLNFEITAEELRHRKRRRRSR